MGHKTIEIDRYQRHGPDAAHVMTIRKPSRTEIPSRFRCRSNVSVEVCRIPAMCERSLDIFAIGLVSWLGPVIPVSVKKRAVAKPNHASIALTGSQDGRAIHPIFILSLQLW